MVSLYNVYTDTEPPRARPGPPRPSSASGGPPAAARCGGVTNPTTEHRDAVGRSEAQLGVCIAHPGLSPGPINRRLRRRAQELLFTRSKCVPERVNHTNKSNRTINIPYLRGMAYATIPGPSGVRASRPRCGLWSSARAPSRSQRTVQLLAAYVHDNHCRWLPPSSSSTIGAHSQS